MPTNTKESGWKSQLKNFDIMSSSPSMNLQSLAAKKSIISTVISYLAVAIISAFGISKLYYYFSLDLKGIDYRSLSYKESPSIPFAQSRIFPWFNFKNLTAEVGLQYVTPVVRFYGISNQSYRKSEDVYDHFDVVYLELSACNKLLEQGELSLYQNNTDNINKPEYMYDDYGYPSYLLNTSLCINSSEFDIKVGRMSTFDQASIQLLLMDCDSKVRTCLNDIPVIEATSHIQTPGLNLTSFKNPIYRLFTDNKQNQNLSDKSVEIPIISTNMQATRIEDTSDLSYFYNPKDVLLEVTSTQVKADPVTYNAFSTITDLIGEDRSHMHLYQVIEYNVVVDGKLVTRRYSGVLDVLAEIGGFYGTIVGILGMVVTHIFSQTTERSILQGTMNIEKSKKTSKRNRKLDQKGKSSEISNSSELGKLDQKSNKTVDQSPADGNDLHGWPRQLVSDKKFSRLAELIEGMFDASSIVQELLKFKMICSLLLDTQTNKLAPLAGLVLVQSQDHKSDGDDKKPHDKGRSSFDHNHKESSAGDFLLRSPLNNKPGSIELRNIEHQHLASKSLDDKIDRKEHAKISDFDDKIKVDKADVVDISNLKHNSDLVQSIKDLFHAYCKATIADSDLDPYGQIDDRPPNNTTTEKIKHNMIDRPVDIQTPDAVLEPIDLNGDKMI